jgi:hypothetical protein
MTSPVAGSMLSAAATLSVQAASIQFRAYGHMMSGLARVNF